MTTVADQDWHLQEWLAHFGKTQTSLVTEVGLNKSTANFIWHGRQPYRRDLVNRIADWLGLRPYELLMRPDEAFAIRSYRDAALRVAAAEAGRPFVHGDHDAPPRTGTGG